MSKELQSKLVAIQQGLKAPKDAYNSFSHYNYRSAESILEAVKPLLSDAGIALLLSDEVKEVGGRCYVEATATLSDGTNEIKVTAFAREAEVKKGMDEAQITGSASSYARKYALSGLFCIDDNKDADTQDNRQAAPRVVTKPKPAEPKQDTELAEAKVQLNEAFKIAGIDNTVKIKLAISKVLEKSTIDNINEANEMLQALEDGIL